jgi:hypothetical protein
MASVQFPPGVKHTVTAEGVVVVLGHRAGGAGVGVDEDALRGLPTKSVHRGLVQWTLRKTGQIEVSAIHVYQCRVVRFSSCGTGVPSSSRGATLGLLSLDKPRHRIGDKTLSKAGDERPN